MKILTNLKELVISFCFSHRDLCCQPDIVVFAFVGKLVVFLEVFTRLKVIGNFPTDFAHRFVTFWAVHNAIITKKPPQG